MTATDPRTLKEMSALYGNGTSPSRDKISQTDRLLGAFKAQTGTLRQKALSRVLAPGSTKLGAAGALYAQKEYTPIADTFKANRIRSEAQGEQDKYRSMGNQQLFNHPVRVSGSRGVGNPVR